MFFDMFFTTKSCIVIMKTKGKINNMFNGAYGCRVSIGVTRLHVPPSNDENTIDHNIIAGGGTIYVLLLRCQRKQRSVVGEVINILKIIFTNFKYV